MPKQLCTYCVGIYCTNVSLLLWLFCECQVASTLEKPPSLISTSRYYDKLPVGRQ